MKKTLITLLIIILVPILILVGMYYFLSPFRTMSNELLRYAPGFIGDHFSKISTQKEIDEQLSEVASYLMDIDSKRAIDKLKIIQKEDASMYDSLLEKMLRLNPNKTRSLLETMRNQNLKKNVLLSTLSSMEDDKKETYKTRADAISKMSDPNAVSFIKDILRDEINPYNMIAGIFDSLDNDRILRIVDFLDTRDVEKIYSAMDSKRVEELKQVSNATKNRYGEITRDAILYGSKSPDEAIKMMSKNGAYSLNDLAIMYISLGAKKSGEILSRSKDNEFIKELIVEIRDYLLLTKSEDKFTNDLMKSINIYKEYADNTKRLVDIYANADDRKIAQFIHSLYWKSDNNKSYKLSNGDVINISDKLIAIDLLKSMPNKKIASVLTNLDNAIATQISTELALPISE